jgi:hypothetical protein
MTWEYYFKPIIAQGEGVKRIGSGGSLGIGSVDIPVATASSYFTQGDPIFVTDGSLGNVSYCGQASSVDADSVTVPLPTRVAYGAHYVIKPAAWVILECDYSAMEIERGLGVENLRASSGKIYRTQTGDPQKIWRIVWEDLGMTSWAAVRTFIESTLNYGLEDFTAAFWDDVEAAQVVACVRLVQEGLPFRTREDQGGALELEMAYVSGSYE